MRTIPIRFKPRHSRPSSARAFILRQVEGQADRHIAEHGHHLTPGMRPAVQLAVRRRTMARRGMTSATTVEHVAAAVLVVPRHVPRTAGTVGRMPRQRQSHATRAGHRRAPTTRAGPDDSEPGEPSASAVAPTPHAARYIFAASNCAVCGFVLLWHGGRLACANRSCPRWGAPS